MNLSEWLSKENMTEAEFARRSGIGLRQTVHKYTSGNQFPGPENLKRIFAATRGEVTAPDLLSALRDKGLPSAAGLEPADAA